MYSEMEFSGPCYHSNILLISQHIYNLFNSVPERLKNKIPNTLMGFLFFVGTITIFCWNYNYNKVFLSVKLCRI